MAGWGMVTMIISTLLIVAALVVGVVLLVRYLAPRSAQGGNDGAERLLAERYARGDIDETEYQQRLSVLRGGPRP
jgi:putative membrane protein